MIRNKVKQILIMLLCTILVLSNLVIYVHTETSALAAEGGYETYIDEKEDLDGLLAAASGDYYLADDVDVDYEDLEDLSFDDFEGSINGDISSHKGEVFDKKTDTIFIHNTYQLDLIQLEEEPVLSGDHDARLIGTGRVFEDDGDMVMYDDTHKYVLASDFTLERPKTVMQELIENDVAQEPVSEEPADDSSDYFDEYTEEYSEEYSEEESSSEEGSEEESESAETEEETTEEAESGEETEEVLEEESEEASVEDAEEETEETEKPGRKKAPSLRAAQQLYPSEKNGRDYFGEVVRQIGNKNYILIGDQQQLRAIGSNRQVTEPVWAVYYEKRQISLLQTEWVVVEDDPDHPIYLFYPGDADLIKFEDGTDWSQKALFSENNGGHSIGQNDYLDGITALGATKRYSYYGSKLDQSGDLTYDETATIRNVNIGTSATYSYDADYIVFRDIFLTQDGTANTATVNWDPIDNFTGTMEGRLDMAVGVNPSINNVTILQNTNVDQSSSSITRTESEYGIGFFRSLVTPYDSLLRVDPDPIEVKNITLNNVSVDTTARDIRQDFSLILALLRPLLELLHLDGGLKKDPKSLATGSFAGVVKGNVKISGCEVTNLDHVNNANDWTGGFVGYTAGVTEYDGVSGALGGLVGTLRELLNLVPVLGLGDLVGILLDGGLLTASQLIPAGYTNAVFVDNSVSYSGTEAVSGVKNTGGFVGESEGSVFKNCDISKSSGLTVSGTDFVGGFAGISKNVIIPGLLTALGVEALSLFPVNTAMFGCDIGGSGSLSVSASSTAAGSGYAGGFIGKMSNSYAVDCSISGLSSVSGNDYVGGFTGYASTGELSADEGNQGLIAIISALLAAILNGNTNAQLLNLVGIRPSVISGVSITGSDISISASGKYAGGIAGYAGALQISNTNDLNDTSTLTSREIARTLSANSLTYTFASRRNYFGASSVAISATDCAGGAIGRGEMTGVAGVLDGTATAVNYTRFELRELDFEGGYVTVAADNAGGIIGLGIGGDIDDVNASGIAQINGITNAGGFGGSFGSGTFANLGGVNLLGLNVLQIDSLLSIGQAIETTAANSSVTGINAGYSVSSSAAGGTSGGFIGLSVSGKTVSCSASNILSVTANTEEGYAGGFIGRAKAGDALSTAGENISTDSLTPLQVSNLLGVASALTPEFHNSSLSFISSANDQVTADHAGGFIGYGEAIDVNYSVNHAEEGGQETYTTITNLGKVHGYSYAGGFAGRLAPGDVAQTGSVRLLGLLNVNELLSVMDVAYPSISNSQITGAPLSVLAEGKAGNVNIGDAGGFIGDGKAVVVEHSNLSELEWVKGTCHAGGYIGFMHSGTAAQAGDATGALLNSVLGRLLNAGELAGVLQAASSDITNCKVSGVSAGYFVEASPKEGNNSAQAQGYAGGYVGEMQSGHVNNFQNAQAGQKGTACENLAYVKGHRYAGGFGGKVASGAVAALGDNLSVLTNIVVAADLLTLISAFVPEIEDASVLSIPSGCYVYVTGTDEADSTSDTETGSAGGYIGYACGLQLKRSDVNKLMHTTVTEPADLQSPDGSSYYSNASEYSVKSYKHSGGYFGKLDIGSTAAMGGTSVLSRLIDLSGLTSALEVVLSTVEDCDTFGAGGGFNVLSTNANGMKGYSGGYAGNIRGSRLTDCNSYNFAHIIGRVSAGGYVGTVEPGAVDRSIENLNLLGGLITATNLLGVLRTFVPEIINSETTCIPCGGAVRADAPSSGGIYRGLAGGYAGYNLGAQIWGLDANSIGTKENAAIRIRSVYGYEYGGGFTGLMQCANIADTGSLSALFGLVQLDNPLSLLQAVYPTEENTAVYGPLRQMSISTWNTWVNVVAIYGPYGEALQAIGEISSEEELAELINTYAYGYAVTGGRSAVAQTELEGSAAGGYVGRMEGGVITNGNGYDLRLAEAYRAAGGFAGEMVAADVASVGSISLAGIDILGSLPLLQTFVPTIKTSSVRGYVSGSTVAARGVDDNNVVGVAGGYVGQMTGGQIWGTQNSRIKAANVRSIYGTSYVGGFVGRSLSGAAATINTTSETGLLHKVLDRLVGATGDLAQVLNATVSTIRYADVEAWDNYGLVINGAHASGGANTAYANAAGGFAGLLSGTVVGIDGAENSGFIVNNLRKVIAGEHAGGAVGKADVASIAEISAGQTNLAGLVELGSIDILSAFRTYIYNSNVIGSQDAGLYVSAKEQSYEGAGMMRWYHGNAGGFGGTMLEATVKDSNVYNMALAEAMNNAGGFAGYMGKDGAVQMEEVEIIGGMDTFNLLGGSLGLIDIFGTNTQRCTVNGVSGGYSVAAKAGDAPVAGGFAGYGDLSRSYDCHALNIKRIESDGIAGGFIGKTSFAYLADIQLDSTLLNILMVGLLNPIIRFLYLSEGTPADLPEIDLGFITIGLLHEDDLVSLNLLGLPISVSLSKDSETDPGSTDFAVVNIGDSVIKLPSNSSGIINPAQNVENIRISLIKANQTRVNESDARGINTGYDVYGADAAGGFVGVNNDGLFVDTAMYLCDTIESADGGAVGPYSAVSSADPAHYSFETVANLEGNNNTYRVYRVSSSPDIRKSGGALISDKKTTYGNYSVYEVSHMNDISAYSEFRDAKIGQDDLKVYISAQKAVLMDDVASKYDIPDSENPAPSAIDDICDEVRSITVNKIWSTIYSDTHPDTIHITLYRTVNIGGDDVTEIVPGYEDVAITGGARDKQWQYIINGLPVYTLDNNDQPAYYHYSVTEAAVSGYSTTIQEADGTATITNRQRHVVPTGASKTSIGWLVCAGLGLAITLLSRKLIRVVLKSKR